MVRAAQRVLVPPVGVVLRQAVPSVPHPPARRVVDYLEGAGERPACRVVFEEGRVEIHPRWLTFMWKRRSEAEHN